MVDCYTVTVVSVIGYCIVGKVCKGSSSQLLRFGQVLQNFR